MINIIKHIDVTTNYRSLMKEVKVRTLTIVPARLIDNRRHHAANSSFFSHVTYRDSGKRRGGRGEKVIVSA